MLPTMNSVSDEVTQSVYKTDYGKREYSSLMTATDSPIELPANWKDAYRDPIRFRYSAMEFPTTQPTETSLSKVPETASFWDKPFAGSSEYMDKISKLALNNMKNQQRYLKPLLPITSNLAVATCERI
ncbi:PREDICTED: uncharacterized protein LOC106744000 [Dinoponera quadriceps]|uniref:Uncharacterized protein LOC106744000 n=1 Tax=Dinoponera quadriceps TaxID=609295 RepID=A0A6P3X7K9_DINQU|nr:PREDICTED: uncharacterized protein LOC106744000 [Dinoponera quadriceps]